MSFPLPPFTSPQEEKLQNLHQEISGNATEAKISIGPVGHMLYKKSIINFSYIFETRQLTLVSRRKCQSYDFCAGRQKEEWPNFQKAGDTILANSYLICSLLD